MKKRSWVKAEAIRLRLEERLSMRQIAERLNSHQGTVSRWVRHIPLTVDEISIRRSAANRKAAITRNAHIFKTAPDGEPLRRCFKCKLYKTAQEFPLKKNGRILGYCLVCRKQLAKIDYAKNKKLYKQRARARIIRIRRAVDAMKDFPCVDCNKKFPPCAMHFDHLDGDGKVASVSALVSAGSWKRILKEIEKCHLVCAICHSIRTNKRARRRGSRERLSLQNLT